MLVPIKRGLGAPAGIDADFVGAYQRFEQLQAATAAQSGGSAAVAAAGASKGFGDGVSAWLSPQSAMQEIVSSFSNLGGANVGYLAGLLSIPAGAFLLLRRR